MANFVSVNSHENLKYIYIMNIFCSFLLGPFLVSVLTTSRVIWSPLKSLSISTPFIWKALSIIITHFTVLYLGPAAMSSNQTINTHFDNSNLYLYSHRFSAHCSEVCTNVCKFWKTASQISAKCPTIQKIKVLYFLEL